MVALLLMLVIPTSAPSWHPPDTLQIEATGRRNPIAEGSDVEIRVHGAEGEILPFTLGAGPSWQPLPDGSLHCVSATQPARLSWTPPPVKGLSLFLTTGPRSGIVTVRWGGVEREIDLYAPGSNAGHRHVRVVPLRPQPPGRGDLMASAVFYTMEAIGLALLALLAISWLLAAPSADECEPQAASPRLGWVGFAAACAVPWFLSLLIFWPALFDSDSMDQWRQMLTGHFNDWHPVFHTLTKWAISRVWLSPAAIAIAQILMLSAAAGWGLVRLRRLGLSSRIVWTTCVLFAVAPANNAMVITLWKDTMYGIAMLILSLMILEVVASHGQWLHRRLSWVALGFVAALVALYRHNGPAPALGTLIVLFFVHRAHWKPLLAASTLAIGLWLGVQVPLRDLLQVAPAGWVGVAPLVHQVAAHVDAGTRMSQADSDYLETIRPLSDRWRYSCYTINPTLFDGRFVGTVISADPDRLVQVWQRLTWESPKVNLRHLACSSSLLWRITEPPGGFISGPALWVSDDDGVISVVPNDLGISSASRLPTLLLPAARFIMMTVLQPEFSWLFWRPALYLYLALMGGGAMSVLRRDWRFMLFLVPIGLQSLTLAPIVLVEHFRFQYPVFLVGLLLGAPLLAGSLTINTAERGGPVPRNSQATTGPPIPGSPQSSQ
jgi:hypothetical protein